MNAQSQISVEQQNLLARSIILQNSVRMFQQIASVSVNPANQNVLNIQPRNVGLTLGFLVIVEADVTNGATDQANITPFGTANLVRQFTYTDLNNVNRIQTTGAHIALLNSAKQGFVFGGSYAANIPIDIGNNYPVFEGPATIAADGSASLRHVFQLPLAYSAIDLRGAVYTNVVNATQNLQIVLNDTPFVGAVPTNDPLNAVYSNNANGAYDGNVTVTVYQIFRDQLPFDKGVPILPLMDLNTVYDLKNTMVGNPVVNQDFAFAYPNMRQFLSTFLVYDNGGEFNAGTDINYFSLESANSTQIFKMGPLEAALFARQTFMADTPPGTYYFDTRDKPIDTISFGNMTLNTNASDVNTGAQIIAFTEAFQQVNQIPYASSLSIGN